MATTPKPNTREMPFNLELGPRLGKGQDNEVYRALHSAEKPHLRAPSGYVIKIDHEKSHNGRERLDDSREAAMAGLLYKKNKYDILKHFLGDFVPDTHFVLGTIGRPEYDESGDKKLTDQYRYAEYMVQKEVPSFSLNVSPGAITNKNNGKIQPLPEDKKSDPRLHDQVRDLMGRLKHMYDILGQANARTADGVTLDGKLDLGGVSDYVKAECMDRSIEEDDVNNIIYNNSSPNLLVDPDTMQLFCIDFDQGQWRPGMDEAKALVFELDSERQTEVAGRIGSAAVQTELPFGQSFGPAA